MLFMCQFVPVEVKCGLFFICTSLAEGRDMFSRSNDIATFDAELWAAMQQEAQRQEEHIELIASENYTSPAVMQAQGDRKSTRLNSSHVRISYAVFCLKKKKK